MSKITISHDGHHYADIDTKDRVLMSICTGMAFDMFRSQGYCEWMLELGSEWASFELTDMTRFNDWRLVKLTTSGGVEFLFHNQTEVNHYVAALLNSHIKQQEDAISQMPVEMVRVMSRNERKAKEKATNNNASDLE